MTNGKKLISLSLISLCCFGAMPVAQAQSKANPNSSELIMYRGMVMTQDEFQKQRKFENSLTYPDNNYVEYDEEIDVTSTDDSIAPFATKETYTARVVPTSEKVQRNIPLTRQEVINEYVRARKAGELDNNELYRN